MPTSSQELQSFQQYATARLQNGGALLELDHLFDEWRNLNQDPRQFSTGTEITVVADAASVSSDAGSIHHEATLIGAPVLSEDAIAVRASLRDIERGETGQPVEDAIREIRAKYNLAGES